VAGGPPPEFGCDEESWSPEHLLLRARNPCQMATFDAAADARGLRVDSYASTARARLAGTATGAGFTGFSLAVHIETAEGEEDRVRATLLRAKERCFVANALRAPVEVDVTVVGAAPRPDPEAVGLSAAR
jgi:organic hydroperoxide reductase OsmC/OhrA